MLTIDSADTRNLDNALSFRIEADGSRVVGVHACDLAAWLRPGSALDFAARRRQESRYDKGNELVIPMLPFSFGNRVLSLDAGTPRLAKSVELRFGPDGKLLGSRIFKSVLVNQHALTFETADLVIAESPESVDPELTAGLKAIIALAGPTRKGAARSPKVIVAEMTQLASIEVAKALSSAGLETSYRNQGLKKKLTLGAIPEGHAGIGAAAYVRWSAPMRSYSDLDVQRAMDRLIANRAPEGRMLELDHKMRETFHDRANGVTPPDQRTAVLKPLAELLLANQDRGAD